MHQQSLSARESGGLRDLVRRRMSIEVNAEVSERNAPRHRGSNMRGPGHESGRKQNEQGHRNATTDRIEPRRVEMLGALSSKPIDNKEECNGGRQKEGDQGHAFMQVNEVVHNRNAFGSLLHFLTGEVGERSRRSAYADQKKTTSPPECRSAKHPDERSQCSCHE